MTCRRVSLLVLAVVFLALLIWVPDVILTVFAGALVAVFLRGGGSWIAARLHVAPGWGVAIFGLGLVAVLAFAVRWFAPAVIDQVNELAKILPEAIENLRARIQSFTFGERLLDRVAPQRMMSETGTGAATTAVSATFGALGNFVLIVFIGIYAALDPRRYREGMIALLAPSIRARGREVMANAVSSLRNWLAAQLMAMATVGVLTALGLWLVGVPLPLLLGLIAALLAFIPNIGPIIAAAPGLLLAASAGAQTVFWALGVYVGVQALESYVVTPLLQQEKVSIPPAFVIAVQLLMGVLFGLLGLALAMPITALAMSLVHDTYIRGYLEAEPDRS